MQNVLNRIIKISIYLLVFLLPLFFLPISFESFEFNKQYLLFFLVSLAFFAWLVKMVLVDKKIRFRWTPLTFFVLAFLFIAILSTVFSVDRSSSLFGFYGRFSNGLIGLLSLGALYFLITNNIRIRSQVSTPGLETEGQVDDRPLSIEGILTTFFWSSSLVVLASYFSVFGIWAKINNLLSLPQVMLQRTFSPVAGSLEGLSIFLAVVAVFLAGLMMGQKVRSRLIGLFRWILFIATLILLIIIDFTPAWLMILVSLILFVIFSLWRRLFRENVNRLLIPIFLIIVATVCIFFQPTRTIFGPDSQIANLPQEQVLNQRTSWSIGYKSATDDVKSGFLGSGLGTFHYDFTSQKPIEINQTWLWQIRFDRAGSYLAETLGTLGFLGILAYLGIIGMFLLISYFLLKTSRFQLPILLTLTLLVGQIFYYQNTTLAFLFWLALGLAVVSWQKPLREKVISFKEFPELSLVFSTIVIILGVALLALFFFGSQFYLANTNYAKAQRMVLGPERVNVLVNAVRLDPSVPRYRIALARAYMAEALSEMAKPLEEQDATRLANIVAEAINQAGIATNLGPNQVATWETRGVIYREIMTVATGAAEWGVKSFERAIALEPTNPVLYTELGKLYLALDEEQKAREEFDRALEQKPDYIDVLIQIALMSERQANFPEAISKMEDLAGTYPLVPEVLFQLGRLYFNNNQIEEAITQFKRVLILSPNHSNAHYSLALTYLAQGEKDLAIQEFEKVLELNPGNQDVIDKLEQLR
ncbi:Cell division coordinator CpoB [subsurface metagenome]